MHKGSLQRITPSQAAIRLIFQLFATHLDRRLLRLCFFEVSKMYFRSRGSKKPWPVPFRPDPGTITNHGHRNFVAFVKLRVEPPVLDKKFSVTGCRFESELSHSFLESEQQRFHRTILRLGRGLLYYFDHENGWTDWRYELGVFSSVLSAHQ